MTYEEAHKRAADAWGREAFVVLSPPQVGYWKATGEGDAYAPVVVGRGDTLKEACERAGLA